MQTVASYSDAKAAAERIVRELANGSQAAALTAAHPPHHHALFHRRQTSLPLILSPPKTAGNLSAFAIDG
jgi:hypothetical protein